MMKQILDRNTNIKPIEPPNYPPKILVCRESGEIIDRIPDTYPKVLTWNNLSFQFDINLQVN